MIRTLYALAIITLSVILALGFTGRFLPLGDSFAVFRLPNLFLLAVLVLCLPKTKFFYVALGCLILGSLSIALHYIPQKTTQQNAYRLYQKNMSYRVNPDALRADILAADADFITLQETAFLEDTEHDFGFISQLKPHYPYQLNCPSARSGLIVMSRWPSTGKGKCFNLHGFGAMNVETPAGRLWLISVHLYWPFPHAQAPQVKSAAQHI